MIFMRSPVSEGEEPKPLHARVRSKGTISGKDFMNQVFREEHMPHAMIVGIMQAISTALGDWLADGYTVEIEGLGFFSTSLKCTRPAMTKKDIRAESIKMSTVKFRPGVEFKRYVSNKMELERADKRFFRRNRKRWEIWMYENRVCWTFWMPMCALPVLNMQVLSMLRGGVQYLICRNL